MIRVLLLCLLVLVTAAPVQAQHPSQLTQGAGIMRGLVAWWRAVPGFTGSTTFYDLSPYRFHGTLTNMGASPTSGWNVTERPGGVMHLAFDGTDDVVTTTFTVSGQPPPTSITPNFPFTLCAWIWVQVAPAVSAEMHVISAMQTAAPYDGPALIVYNAAGVLGGFLYIGTGGTGGITPLSASSSLAPIPLQTWTHLCGTYDGSGDQSGMMYYQNGQFVVAGTALTITGVWVERLVNLGGDTYAALANLLNGKMDDVRIWRRALSPAEIRHVYRVSMQGDQDLFQASRGSPMQQRVGNPGGFFNFFR